MEGGANVVSEAAVAGLPVIASRIPGNVGLLGRGYPGYFPVGDEQALARLLRRAEENPGFLVRLERALATRARLFRPASERAMLKAALARAVAKVRERSGSVPEFRRAPSRGRSASSGRNPRP